MTTVIDWGFDIEIENGIFFAFMAWHGVD